MLENGAAINCENSLGTTPLGYALYEDEKYRIPILDNKNINIEYGDTVSLLIENGANISYVNKYGETLLDYVKRHWKERNDDKYAMEHDYFMYKSLDIGGDTEVIFMHKQVNVIEHYVVTHGAKEDSKFKFFKLTFIENGSFNVVQYTSAELAAEVSRVLMGEIDAVDSKLLTDKSQPLALPVF